MIPIVITMYAMIALFFLYVFVCLALEEKLHKEEYEAFYKKFDQERQHVNTSRYVQSRSGRHAGSDYVHEYGRIEHVPAHRGDTRNQG